MSDANITMLEERREDLCKKLFLQICDDNHKLNYLIPPVPTVEPTRYYLRHPRQVAIIKCNTERARHSFINYCANKYMF